MKIEKNKLMETKIICLLTWLPEHPGEVLWEFLGGDVPLGPWSLSLYQS